MKQETDNALRVHRELLMRLTINILWCTLEFFPDMEQRIQHWTCTWVHFGTSTF